MVTRETSQSLSHNPSGQAQPFLFHKHHKLNLQTCQSRKFYELSQRLQVIVSKVIYTGNIYHGNSWEMPTIEKKYCIKGTGMFLRKWT
uniref:Uncharacterized protein n=1 Tax=Anguilla anguilla TaxID=7936 RepID=A0A0E9WT51_ANGAN